MKCTCRMFQRMAGLSLMAALMAGCAAHTSDSQEKGGVYEETSPARKAPEVSPYSPLQMLLPLVKKHGGSLTRDQLRADLREEFNAADKDHDGKLNKAEMRAVNDALWKKYGAGTTPLQDWNGDGYIDFEEFGGTAWTLFTELDRNHDNVITLKDIDPAEVKKKHPEHKPGGRPPPPQPANLRN